MNNYKKMKYVLILSILIVLLLCSCVTKANFVKNIDRNSFEVVDDENSRYGFLIYDNDNSVLYRENNIEQPVYLTKNNSLITISIDYGTGLQSTRFFDLNTRMMSEEFWYVASNNDDLVAYIAGDDLDNRTLVIRNIFDENEFFYQTNIDFARIDTPIKNAEFLSDNSLKIEYINSENKNSEKTVRF